MIVIGEKINSSVPAVGDAIERRDAAIIQKLAVAQAKAGAHYIDCCAAAVLAEAEALKWLVSCVEQVTEVPICLDSVSAEVLEQVLPCMKRPGLVNSVTGELDRAERMFGLLAEQGMEAWGVVVLLMDQRGIPVTAKERLDVLEQILEMAARYGISKERIFVDPIVEMACVLEDGARTALDTMAEIRSRYPDIHITAAASNVSFGLPDRRMLNRAFAVLAMNAGADCLLADPTDHNLMRLLSAAGVLLGMDEDSLDYIETYKRSRC